MRLFLDILQGAGVSAAAGLRPFLPTFLVGGLATADLGVDFDGTAFAFLESPAFLIAIVLAAAVAMALERRMPQSATDGPLAAALAGIGLGLGALLFAGTLDDRFDTWWYGLPLGLACAALAQAATRGVWTRVRSRLDADARDAVPVYAEGAALLAAGASVLFPPLALVVLGFLGRLLAGTRRRGREKYAGLRILR